MPEREVGRLTALLRALNPEARILVTHESRVAPKEVVGTGRFSMERAARAAGWLKVSVLPRGKYALALRLEQFFACMLHSNIAAEIRGAHAALVAEASGGGFVLRRRGRRGRW